MDHIYIYEGQFKQGDEGFPLIREAAVRYCLENQLDYDVENTGIIREAKGKPYFTDIPLEFSLTHSGQRWMCMFSGVPCGLDLQEVRDCDHEGISARFYGNDEQKYVKDKGLAGFFDIWVRKEAFCKCCGTGFFADMPETADKDGLKDQIVWQGAVYYFTEIPLTEELKCVYCSNEKKDVEMRLLG